MVFKKEKINEDLIKQAFSKIKHENEDLKKRLEILEKKMQELAKPKQETIEAMPKKETELPISLPNSKKEIETIKTRLTQSEKEILYLFTMSREKSYTYEEIADIMKKSAHTVKAQIQSMIKKGINLSFSQNDKGQRSFYLDNSMFERIIMSKN